MSRRDMDDHNNITIMVKNLDVILFYKVNADLFCVVNRIPELFLEFGSILKSGSIPTAVFVFFYSE